jgi:hypothetical protein
MHAVVVNATIDSNRTDEAKANLEANVVPMVKQSPGAVCGYWLVPEKGRGLSMVIFDSEETARAAAEMVPNVPRPDFVTIDTIEVREIAAQF